MSRIMRLFWVVALLIFLGGCSGFRPLGSPRSEPKDPCYDLMGSLEVGDRVRLTLEDASTITGQVAGLTPDSLTMETDNEPRDLQEIPVCQIMILEKGNRGSSAGQAATIVLAVGLFAVVIAGAAGSQADSDWGGFGGGD